MNDVYCVRGIRKDCGATTRQSSYKGFLYQFQYHLTGVPAGLNRSVTSEALCPKPIPGSPSWLRYASATGPTPRRSETDSCAGPVDRRLISTWSWVLSEMTLSSIVVIKLPGNEPGREHTSSMERRQTSWRLASILMNKSRQTSWKN
jgi:hypothetical protein